MNSPLMSKSKAFAVDVISACKVLRDAKCENELIWQFLRSGTSIGANVQEAFFAQGKADFISKLHIALKECSETEYWIDTLMASGYYNKITLLEKCIELKKFLITSIKTAKENTK